MSERAQFDYVLASWRRLYRPAIAQIIQPCLVVNMFGCVLCCARATLCLHRYMVI